eukprot:144094_1
MLTVKKLIELREPDPNNFDGITFVVTAQCMCCLFLTESYKSVLSGNLVFCTGAGILQSLCQNKKFNVKTIKIMHRFIDNFGNTFTSYSSLVYVSCAHFNNHQNGNSLWTVTVNFYSQLCAVSYHSKLPSQWWIEY